MRCSQEGRFGIGARQSLRIRSIGSLSIGSLPWRVLLVLVLTAALLPGLPTVRASAETITVNSTADEPDGEDADDQCDTGGGGEFATGVCTLRAAIMHVNSQEDPGHTIILPDPNDVDNDPDDAYRLTITDPDGDGMADVGDLDVTTSVTITGAGAAVTVIDASGLGDRIFDVFEATAVDLTLEDLALTGGQASQGGAVRHQTSGGVLTLTDVLVDGNEAVDSPGTGGGVSVGGGTLRVTGGAFEANDAAVGGGGVDARIPAGHTLEAVQTRFDDNDAPAGGALDVDLVQSDGGVGSLLISGTTLTGNDATTGDGGAVRVVESIAIVVDSMRTAAIDPPVAGATLDDVTVEQGGAGGRGGGVFAGEGVGLTITGSTFRDLTSMDQGGAVYAGGESLSTSSSQFRRNWTFGASRGGAIAAETPPGAVVEIADVAFAANAAGVDPTLQDPDGDLADGASGGAVRVSASLLRTDAATTFTGNHAGGDGGAVHANDVELLGTLLTDNLADGNGGALALTGDAEGLVDGSTFRANHANQDGTGGGDGGAIWVQSGSDRDTRLTVLDSDFEDNRAAVDDLRSVSGGAISAQDDTRVTVGRPGEADPEGSRFRRNAAVWGGALATTGALTVVGSSIADNTASDEGGGVHVGLDDFVAELDLQRSAVTGNSAGRDGGGLFVASETAMVRVATTTISDNAGSRGGGIYNRGDLQLVRTTVAFNRVSDVNGAALVNEGTLELDHTLIACHPGSDTCVLGPGATSVGHNLTDDPTCNVTGAGSHDTDDVALHEDIDLDGLHDNGGPTLTHALRPGSPAVDFGLAAACPEPNDQRGVAVVDGDGDGTAACDVGAFEFEQGVSVHAVSDADEDGPTSGTFLFRRQGPTDTALDVGLRSAGTATPGDDYAPLPSTVTIPAGASETSLDVMPVDDGEPEPDETVTVELRTAPAYTLGTNSTAIVRILDARPNVHVTTSDADANEEGPDDGAFRFRRDGHLGEPLDVIFDVTGTATEGLDVAIMPRSLRIPAGSETATVTVEVLPDDVEDPGELVGVVLRDDPGYTVGAPASAVLRIDEPSASVVRTGGRDRVATSVEVSRTRFLPGVAEAVVLARSDTYPDALAGGPLAASLRAPILLTPPSGLAGPVATEIDRLGIDHVVLLGGEEALSAQVAADLTDIGVGTIERIGGRDRFATAAMIARRLPGTPAVAHVTEGANADTNRGWPDAVSVSGLASRHLRPILLVTRDQLPAATADIVAELDLDRLVIAGGEAAVSATVEERLRATGALVERLAGPSRYDTSVAIARRSVDEGADPRRVWLATGLAFPDALVAGPAVAEDDGVLLLVDGQDLGRSSSSRDWIAEQPRDRLVIRILGGDAAIDEQVARDLEDIVGAS